MILNQYNSRVEKLSDILKRKEFNMVRSVCNLFVVIKKNIDSKYLPKNVRNDNVYPVVAEKCIKYKKENNEYEELTFGIINDVFELVYVASFNVKISTKYDDLIKYANEPEQF